MGYPLFLYENMLEGATLSASTTAAGSDVNNIDNGLPDVGYWQNVPASESVINTAWLRFNLGSAQSPDTLAITTHNLGTLTAGFGINYSDTGTPPYTVGLSQAGLIDNDASFVWNFGTSLGSHQYWEFAFDTLNPGVALVIGAVCLGRKWEWPMHMAQGFDPESLTLKYREQRARPGSFSRGTVDHVDQRVDLKFGPAGLSRTGFHEVTTRPGFRDFHRTHWSNGKPWWAKWSGDYFDTNNARPGWYCRPDNNDKSSTPQISAMYSGWKFGFNVKAENYQQVA